MVKKAKPIYTGQGTYKVLATKKTDVKKFVNQIDMNEGQRPGITGVLMSKPAHVKRQKNLAGYYRLTPRTPRLK